MRAGFGLIGLLIVVGVIVWIMHKSTLPYTQQVLKQSESARKDVNQLAGNSRDGQMKFSESVDLETETSGGKISAIDVTKVAQGGPAETYFGLKEGDAIVEILPLGPVKGQINSEDDAKAFVQEAYQRQQQLVVMRDGNRLTLPQNQNRPPSAVGKVNQANKQAIDETQQQINVHSLPGMP